MFVLCYTGKMWKGNAAGIKDEEVYVRGYTKNRFHAGKERRIEGKIIVIFQQMRNEGLIMRNL